MKTDQKASIASEQIARAKTADAKRAILAGNRPSRIKRLAWHLAPRVIWAGSFALVGFGIACLVL